MGGVERNQKKDNGRITHTIIKRIVALSYQNPDFGARRLAPLLKKENISLSPSTIYIILHRHGLETRARRLSRLKIQTAEAAPILEKSHAGGNNSNEERVVALSLQNPDYGARRLFLLLEKEKIFLTESAIYNILRLHGMQNRTLRISKLAQQQAAASPILDKVDQPDIQNRIVAATKPVSLPQKKTRKKRSRRKKTFRKEKLIFFCIDIMFLALIGYFGLQAKMNYRQFFESEITDLAPPVLVAQKKSYDNSIQPLEFYKGTWQGNLFKTSQKKNHTPKKIDQALPKSIPLAEQDHGLELRGTVVRDDSAQRVAVIYQRHANHQDTYKQGDRVGRVIIKKILRDKIIINAGRGDELLSLDFNNSAPKKPPYKFKAASTTPRIRYRKVSLDRKQFEDSLANLDRHWDSLEFAPHLNDGQPDGIIVKGLKYKNLLFEMGVRNGDVIKGINEQEYQSPDQADDIFDTMQQSDQYKIMLLRGKSPIEYEVTIQ